jgi:beta-glucosidase
MEADMPDATFHFPRGFLWGTATASHQVEGDNTNNNWWAWEQQPGRIQQGHTSALACDWWAGRWQEDFDRAAEAGQNAHRFSVEWSRIQPTPDTWDESALEQYRQMLRGLRDRNMLPLVSLHHFSDPLWLSEQGGWENPEVVAKFEKYVRRTVEGLKEYVSLWCTINEPNVYVLGGYVTGDFPPGQKNIKLAMHVMANMLRGHAAAYRAIHEIQPEARVGYALHYRPVVPATTWFPLDRLAANLHYKGINMAFPSALSSGVMQSVLGNVRIPEAKGTQDYLGLNYYNTLTVKFDLLNPGQLFGRAFYPAGTDLSDTGFNANIPDGMFASVKWAVRTYPGLPVIITENGIECADDHIRPRYIAEHVLKLWRAVNFNWPVKGYFHWSLVDNFEWERGWTQRFGLWGLDPETQVRSKRPSADLYAEICKENGLSSHMVRKYCPEVFEKLFPG